MNVTGVQVLNLPLHSTQPSDCSSHLLRWTWPIFVAPTQCCTVGRCHLETRGEPDKEIKKRKDMKEINHFLFLKVVFKLNFLIIFANTILEMFKLQMMSY